MKFDTTIEKLQSRVVSLRPKLRAVAALLDDAEASRPVSSDEIEALIQKTRREAAEVMVALRSLLEVVAAGKPTAETIKKVQHLRREHEVVLDQLGTHINRFAVFKRVGPISSASKPSGGEASSSSIYNRLAQSSMTAVPSAERLQIDLEQVLDREASLRAQFDLLKLKFERLLEDYNETSAKLEKRVLDHSAALEASGRKDTELRELQSQSDNQLMAAIKFSNLLSEDNRYLRSKLRYSALPLQYALMDELELYEQESIFLNPKLLRLRPLSKAEIAKQARLISQSGLFDASHYIGQFEGGLPPGADPLTHYLTTGWRAGKDPQPLFSVRFYLMRNQNLALEGAEPLGHYIQTGSADLRDPHPLFVTSYYASKHGGMLAKGQTWLGHFLEIGPPPPSPHPIFDPVEYAKRAGLDESHTAVALLDYVRAGWQKKTDISPLFDSQHYSSQVGDAVTGEPYLHYAIYGAPHGLSPHPLFDLREYLTQVPDLDPQAEDPLFHYLTKGEPRGVSPSPYFSPVFYRDQYLGGSVERSSLLDYLAAEPAAKNAPTPDFDSAVYRDLTGSAGQAIDLVDIQRFANYGMEDIPRDALVALFSDKQRFKHVAPAVRFVPPAAIASMAIQASAITRNYPGKAPRREGSPNILVVAHIASEHLFGSERSFLDMIDALAKVPANVYVALPRNVPDYTNAIRLLSQHVYIVNYKWWRRDEDISQPAIDGFKKIIADHNIDAVHVNTIMLREPLQAARDSGVPGIVHVRELIPHDDALQELIGKTSDEIIEITKTQADWVIGNSAITAKTFHKADRTVTIPNTIDVDVMDMPNVVDRKQVRFGLISSNIPKKGIVDVVELARLCEKKCPAARFVLIGPETDLVRELKQKQASGDVPANIEFPGYASSPKEAVGQLNVVLNFSHFAESFGRTVLEAMAARRPVIAYAWGALPELIDHDKTGYLVPHKKPAKAVEFISKLCASPALVEELGKRAREVAVSKFGLVSYRKQFAEAYARILSPEVRAEIAQARALPKPLVRSARLADIKLREEKPCIAYFCWHFPVPSETFVLNELEVLVRNGVDVIVFCRQTPYKDFKPSFDIKFERVDSAKTLAKRLRETSRTIVHAHFVYPVVTDMVWPACEEAEIPFTFIAHAQDIFRHENDQKNRLAEIGASKWCRKMFTLSRFHLEFVAERGFPRDKIVINPNAVDTKRFSAAFAEGREERTTRRIIAVHRFVKKKGLELLIRAAPLVADLGVQIDIYGYGDLNDEYLRLIDELKLTNVAVRGALSQDQVVQELGKADLFASPSVRVENGDMDGIPTSIVESMAAGVPVLTTNVAGIPDLVIDEVTGIVAEPTPEAVADAIRRFYAMPSLKVRSIIKAAAVRARERHDVNRLTRVLMRVWRNETVDLVIVSWNNLAELKMVVERILENTALPYHLIICDNQSQNEPVGAYLDDLWQRHPRVTVVHNNRNAMVGPGTNTALAQGGSDYAIYVCGREGVSFANGWEIPFIHTMEDSPDVGLAGSIGYSPTYLFGEQYPKGIPLFADFRNPEFASDNAERVFGHVQGGLFGMRRKMVDEIGGFSDAVPHNYTDVEYSYYAESKGWKLTEVPSVLALFNKSRPTLSQRFDETLVVAHPVLPDDLKRYDAVAAGKLFHCNLCDWYGEAFHSTKCPSCASSPQDRTLYRWLSEGIFMYRRLPALAVDLGDTMDAVWAKQFQGPRMSMVKFTAELNANKRLPNRAGTFHVACLRYTDMPSALLKLMVAELKRLLVRGGAAVFQIDAESAGQWDKMAGDLKAEMTEAGFQVKPDILYASRAIDFSFVPMLVIER